MSGSLDKQEVDRLVVELLPDCLRLATRLTNSAARGEEVVQEALVRVARSWATFRGDASFRSWLFRIVIHVVRDTYDRGRETLLEDDVVDRGADDPSAIAIANELGDIVTAAINQLPERQRQVLLLLKYEGLTVPEVADTLGIQAANVHANFHLASKRLRAKLAPYFAENGK